MATATPLEAACKSPQQAASAIDALVLEGARLDGIDGARALIICFACGRRHKARLLLQRQVLPFSRQVKRSFALLFLGPLAGGRRTSSGMRELGSSS
jgi:hypothetical protein